MAKLKAVHSKFYSATSSAPEIDRLVAETGRTRFTKKKYYRCFHCDTEKVRLLRYNGTLEPKGLYHVL